jgi:hypothetical protein
LFSWDSSLSAALSHHHFDSSIRRHCKLAPYAASNSAHLTVRELTDLGAPELTPAISAISIIAVFEVFRLILRTCEWLEQIRWIVAVNSSVSGAVVVELIHYLSFFLLVGTIVFVDLRVLGIAARDQSVTAVAEQLFPLTWLGLTFATLSGFILFAGYATAFVRTDVFQFKIFVILAASIFGFLVQWRIARQARLSDKSIARDFATRLLAVVSLVLWIGAILASLEVAALTGLG